ncbi:hypothetical protein Dred_1120 [Desulforamulus reducens MI-1]|uniref:Uncharacterized protein n=1 Tax=Desulforamulus reducens (strain ATCC BAA-1160 / DSM 100696 / MI-1) TaxID=349161 RepID=A4J3K2_DESRM|nr:hypothetical protein [Desulforamulus reducens]ABO49655.1 hypothetical protein Dred_1120 [Desulforamulus reducens MI-1]
MGCSSCGSGGLGGISVGSSDTITELIRVIGLDEANKMLAKDYVFVSMYFNQTEQQEIYILSRVKPTKKTGKTIGFIPRD